MGNKKTDLDSKSIRELTAEELKALPHVKGFVRVETSNPKKGSVTKRYVMEVNLFDNAMTLRFYFDQAYYYIIKKLWQKTSDDFVIYLPYRLITGETEDLREDHKGEWNRYCFFETLPCGVSHPDLYMNRMLSNNQVKFLKVFNYLGKDNIIDRGRKQVTFDEVNSNVLEEEK